MYMHTHTYMLQCVAIGIKPGVLCLLGQALHSTIALDL